MTACSSDRRGKKRLKTLMHDLIAEGILIRSGRLIGLADKLPLVRGRLEVQRSGVGFVIPQDKRRKDIFVSPDNFSDAWPNDLVLVAILPRRRGRNPEGRIIQVLERALNQLPCQVLKGISPTSLLCRPTDPLMSLLVTTDCSALSPRPKAGDIILVTPHKGMDTTMWQGTATSILGREEDLAVQEQLVKIGHGIPGPFPHAVIREADEFPGQPCSRDCKNRKDLRELPLVTIDGTTARDFDDAIHVTRTASGFCLHVAIADVSHYVRPGSHLDHEALERGNSSYFPLSVEPMLPKALSNGLCSLNPGEPRLAMIAEMRFSLQGMLQTTSFYPAVIQSHARLTYAQVNEALFVQNTHVCQEVQSCLPMLQEAASLAHKLVARRQERGAIDFNLPEAQIIQDPATLAIRIVPKPRHFGHQMIEEFMLAANEAVAAYLTTHHVPFLYRVHPPPDQDKLDALFSLLARTDLGCHLPKGRSPKELQELLALAQSSNMAFLVNRLMLRSMMKAGYSPNNEGHFGLASDCYCHFTSPIRRYADINVHRALKTCLGLETARMPTANILAKQGEGLNQCERKSLQAEREMLKRATTLYLRDHLGEVFQGVISGLADCGFWVELEGILAEGRVRMASLTNDSYAFLKREQIILGQRTGSIYKLGQAVRVRVRDASLGRLEIDLEVVTSKCPRG